MRIILVLLLLTGCSTVHKTYRHYEYNPFPPQGSQEINKRINQIANETQEQ